MAKNALDQVNSLFQIFEKRGWIDRTSGFIENYHDTYPHFSILEENYDVIREECEQLLKFKEKIIDIEGLAGGKTVGGIHSIKWKSFVFKSGKYVKKNCDICPKTTQLLKKLPRTKQIFFSILDPDQYIRPHQGYYYGFLRYHLGVIIPDNNDHNECWLRINDDPTDNLNNDKTTLEKGQTYNWKNGEGVMFNDNYLHDAKNGSNQVRVILWIDVIRKFPWPIDILNRLILKLAYLIPEAKKIAKRAEIDLDVKPKYT